MKVIKEGEVRRITCGGCDSVLEYTKGDVEEYDADPGSMLSTISTTVKCPICNRKTGVKPFSWRPSKEKWV